MEDPLYVTRTFFSTHYHNEKLTKENSKMQKERNELKQEIQVLKTKLESKQKRGSLSRPVVKELNQTFDVTGNDPNDTIYLDKSVESLQRRLLEQKQKHNKEMKTLEAQCELKLSERRKELEGQYHLKSSKFEPGQAPAEIEESNRKLRNEIEELRNTNEELLAENTQFHEQLEEGNAELLNHKDKLYEQSKLIEGLECNFEESSVKLSSKRQSDATLKLDSAHPMIKAREFLIVPNAITKMILQTKRREAQALGEAKRAQRRINDYSRAQTPRMSDTKQTPSRFNDSIIDLEDLRVSALKNESQVLTQEEISPENTDAMLDTVICLANYIAELESNRGMNSDLQSSMNRSILTNRGGEIPLGVEAVQRQCI